MAKRVRFRLTTARRAGLALIGVLGVTLAVASGTAFATSGAPAAGMAMAGMTPAASNHVGNTKGWFHHRVVTFHYTRNYFCNEPPASKASSKCEAGTNYTQTPANTFDPLYVVVPLGFTPPKSTLQCPTAGRCIDHPHTIDLSAVLGSGTSNALLPPHSHIVATSNHHQGEWWNVDVVGVSSRSAWNKIVSHKSDWELRSLQKHDSKDVTGNITTNLFLYFAVHGRHWR